MGRRLQHHGLRRPAQACDHNRSEQPRVLQHKDIISRNEAAGPLASSDRVAAVGVFTRRLVTLRGCQGLGWWARTPRGEGEEYGGATGNADLPRQVSRGGVGGDPERQVPGVGAGSQGPRAAGVTAGSGGPGRAPEWQVSRGVTLAGAGTAGPAAQTAAAPLRPSSPARAPS